MNSKTNIHYPKFPKSVLITENGNMKITDCLKICKNDFSISTEPMGRHTQNHVPWLSFLAGQKKKTLRSIIFQRFSWWVIGWIQHQDWYSVYLPNISGARSRNKQRSMKQPATLCSSRQTDSKAPLVQTRAVQKSTQVLKTSLILVLTRLLGWLLP